MQRSKKLKNYKKTAEKPPGEVPTIWGFGKIFHSRRVPTNTKPAFAMETLKLGTQSSPADNENTNGQKIGPEQKADPKQIAGLEQNARLEQEPLAWPLNHGTISERSRI